MERPKTYKQCLEIAVKVASAQKDPAKRHALNHVNEAFEQALSSNRKLYSVVPNCCCRHCGGVILSRESFFPMVTPGGNSIRGCPVCDTFKIIKQDSRYFSGGRNALS